MSEKETITAADVGVLDLRTGETPKVERYPSALTFARLRPGMDVVFVDSTLNVHHMAHVDGVFESNRELVGKIGRVVAVDPDAPGKTVALCMKAKVTHGHSCDGRVPQGHGAYAMPEHLYTVESWKRHTELALEALEKQKTIDELIEGFVEG